METMVSVDDNNETMTEIVTAFVRNRGEVLVTRRGADAEVDSGRWDGISGSLATGSGSRVDAGRRLVRDLTGLSGLTLAYAGESFTV